ncbi:MAG: RimK family alpha-L-glutamate ligase [Bacteriovoracia bacterium]
MNKKICLVAKNKETYFIKRLIEEVGQSEVTLFNPWSDLEIPAADVYVVRTTGVYGSDLDLMLLKSLPAERIINPLPVLNKFRSKTVQYQWMDEENFPVLPWLSLKGMDLLMVEKFFRLYPEMVVKPTIGQGGWGVEGLTWESFKTWKNKKGKDEDYLLQPFVKNSRELRVFFCKGIGPLVLERRTKSGIAANFKKSGEARAVDLPSELTPLVSGLIEKSGAFYGAMDIILDENRPYVLEMNSVPGIEQLEQVSGKNVMLEFLKSLLCQN